MEKVALRRRQKKETPLILIVNSTHLVRDDEDGRDLLEMIQQRAEQWAASNLVTMSMVLNLLSVEVGGLLTVRIVFNSDDYWVYERLKRYAARMEVIPVPDLPKDRALMALRQYRAKYFQENLSLASPILNEVYERVGGRLNYLNRVAKTRDMLATCDAICQAERRWFLNKCWILGEEMDDDVMDEQKYSVC